MLFEYKEQTKADFSRSQDRLAVDRLAVGLILAILSPPSSATASTGLLAIVEGSFKEFNIGTFVDHLPSLLLSASLIF